MQLKHFDTEEFLTNAQFQVQNQTHPSKQSGKTKVFINSSRLFNSLWYEEVIDGERVCC